MNILMVSSYQLYRDFSNSFVHKQAAAYAQLGHHVRVLLLIAMGRKTAYGNYLCKPYQWAFQDGVELLYINFLSLSNFGDRSFNIKSAKAAVVRNERVILKNFTPDIIHAHSLSISGPVGHILKKRLHCPLVVTTHGSDSSVPLEEGKTEEIRLKCNQADTIVAVSHALAEKVRGSGTSTPVISILNGFDAHNLKNTLQRIPLSIMQASSLCHQKRADITIEAFAALRQKYPDCSLTIVGEGERRQELEALCQKLQIADSVTFTGQMPNSTLLKKMAETEYFVMPSVREGFGIVYLEAMASGCITIGTKGEGIADLIEDSVNGFLVEPDNPAAIVSKIESCISDPQRKKEISAEGSTTAKKLTWEENARNYVNLFKSL